MPGGEEFDSAVSIAVLLQTPARKPNIQETSDGSHFCPTSDPPRPCPVANRVWTLNWRLLSKFVVCPLFDVWIFRCSAMVLEATLMTTDRSSRMMAPSKFSALASMTRIQHATKMWACVPVGLKNIERRQLPLAPHFSPRRINSRLRCTYRSMWSVVRWWQLFPRGCYCWRLETEIKDNVLDRCFIYYYLCR